MKYHIIKLILIKHFILVQNSHTGKNNSDIFITYSGHSDLERPIPVSKQESITEITVPEKKEPVEITETYDEMTDGVVFIPNDKTVVRNEDVLYNGDVKIGDVMDTRRVGGLMESEKGHTETEPPQADILFVSGKNNENVEKPVEYAKNTERRDSTVIKKARNTRKRVNCTDITCNNTVNSVCGGKQDNKQYKYRLFLNECFFNKVNCGFQHAVNKYEMVPLENCKNIGAHYLSKPYVFKPIPLPAQKETVKVDARRSFSSRRSMSLDVDGSVCGHACPASCTEEHDPQCAVSSSGQRRVFVNHCRLDYNSCLYKVAWHRRPLSECVGRRKADMTQNRGFIGWMQRVGIVDRKGKLMLA